MLRFIICFLCMLAFFSCKKDVNKKITFSGTLLQSSSNPVPVSDYKLSFYQSGGGNSAPIPITAGSSSIDCNTNTDGSFECNFPLGRGTFFGIPTTNDAPIFVSGLANTNIQLYWSDLPAYNVAIGNMYLYKKVHKAVIKIEASTDIIATDTIYIQAPTLAGYYKKQITGLSISQNAEQIIDTITDVIYTYFSFQTKKYQPVISVVRNGADAINPFTIPESMLDDEEKEYLIPVL